MRFSLTVILVILICRIQPPAIGEQPASESVRSAILDDPLDFSQPPKLPQIEPASEADLRESIQRGVKFLLQRLLGLSDAHEGPEHLRARARRPSRLPRRHHVPVHRGVDRSRR